MAQVMSPSKQEANFFLDLNNDINRILHLLDNSQDIKKLLFHIEADALSRDDIKISLVDKTICRKPIVPLENTTDNDASYLIVTMLAASFSDESNAAITNVAIDILTPLEQWVIDEGLRPLIIGKYVNQLMRYNFNQTSGVKYRLTDIININLSDRLVGYRLVYATGLDD